MGFLRCSWLSFLLDFFFPLSILWIFTLFFVCNLSFIFVVVWLASLRIIGKKKNLQNKLLL